MNANMFANIINLLSGNECKKGMIGAGNGHQQLEYSYFGICKNENWEITSGKIN